MTRVRLSLKVDALKQIFLLKEGDIFSVGKVRKAFETRRGAKGSELYRMLWGYSAQQLASGAAQRLVNDLDHSDLDFRVLAFWNLRHITGYSLYYRPETPAAQRKQSIKKWVQKLESGLIVPKEPDK